MQLGIHKLTQTKAKPRANQGQTKLKPKDPWSGVTKVQNHRVVPQTNEKIPQTNLKKCSNVVKVQSKCMKKVQN